LKTEGLEEWLCLPSKCKALVQTPVPPPAKRKKKKSQKKSKKKTTHRIRDICKFFLSSVG
jgi:hypothetical protein